MTDVSSLDAAKILGVDESTIRRYIYRGLLKARRFGLRKIIRIEMEDLRSFAAEYEFRINEEVVAEVQE